MRGGHDFEKPCGELAYKFVHIPDIAPAVDLPLAHFMDRRESIHGDLAGLEGPGFGVVQHGKVAIDRKVMDDMFVVDQMVKGDSEPPHRIFRADRTGILGGDVFVLDFRIQTVHQGFPVLSTECGPHTMDGLEIGFSGHDSPYHGVRRCKFPGAGTS